VTLELGQVVAAWPLGASLAAAAAAQGLRAGRRRGALNEALHELRRPLQVLALAAPREAREGAPDLEWSVRMAGTALERLEREVNGEAPVIARFPIFARPLLEAAVLRWRSRAAMAGRSIDLRWRAGDAMVEGDPCALAQALDNLLINAIEHGGATIEVDGRIRRGRLSLAIADSGSRPGRAFRRRPTKLSARLSGRRRRGHGLRVVRRVARGHGGAFHLRRLPDTTEAVLELPLLAEVEVAREPAR
jgi:signal transduction histidine kinase